MAKLKALIVEDDKKFGEKLGNFLKVGFDCDVVLKFSGADAISILDKEKFQILLLDLKMPGIESVGVLELFDILAKQIQLLEQGQSTDTQKLVTDANGRVVNQSIPAPPLPVFGDMYTDAYGQRISDR